MATKIKLMRLGKMRAPYYRIVVADARTKRDGRSIETIGKYHPKEDPSFIQVDSERAQYWLGVGAQPTDAVAAIFRVTGDWQKFKGEAAPTEPVKTAAPRPDRKAIFEAAAKESLADAEAKPAKKTAAKKAAPAAEAAPAPEAAAEEPTAEAAVALATQYRGRFALDFAYEDWAAARRERLRELRHDLLTKLAQLYESRQQVPQSIECVKELLVQDNTDEAAHRQLMRLYAMTGSRHQALRQ